MTTDYTENIISLRDLIPTMKSISHLVTRTDDNFLLRFLKTAKNDLKKASKRYEEYYKILSKLPKADTIISGKRENYQWLLDAMKEFDEMARVSTSDDSMPARPLISYYGTDASGRHILGFDSVAILKSVDLPAKNGDNNFLEACTYSSLILLEYLSETFPDLNDTGVISIEDQKHFNLKMLTIFIKNPSFTKNWSKLMDGTLPIRFHKCFIANGPKLISVCFKMLKPFMSQKMLDKFFIVDDVEIIRQEVGGDDNLPFSLGGGNHHQELYLDYEEMLRKVFPVLKGAMVDRVGDAGAE